VIPVTGMDPNDVAPRAGIAIFSGQRRIAWYEDDGGCSYPQIYPQAIDAYELLTAIIGHICAKTTPSTGVPRRCETPDRDASTLLNSAPPFWDPTTGGPIWGGSDRPAWGPSIFFWIRPAMNRCLAPLTHPSVIKCLRCAPRSAIMGRRRPYQCHRSHLAAQPDSRA
jgi:hypothetical protein